MLAKQAPLRYAVVYFSRLEQALMLHPLAGIHPTEALALVIHVNRQLAASTVPVIYRSDGSMFHPMFGYADVDEQELPELVCRLLDLDGVVSVMIGAYAVYIERAVVAGPPWPVLEEQIVDTINKYGFEQTLQGAPEKVSLAGLPISHGVDPMSEQFRTPFGPESARPALPGASMFHIARRNADRLDFLGERLPELRELCDAFEAALKNESSLTLTKQQLALTLGCLEVSRALSAHRALVLNKRPQEV